MKLIKPEVIDITQTDYSLKGIYKQIELAGRTCYKSEDRITEDSAEPFVKMLIDRGHTAMLEHGTVYLNLKDGNSILWSYNPYSYIMLGKDNVAAITTNLRVILQNHYEHLLKEENLQYTFGHFRRVSFRIICSIGIARELCRHRVFSFAQESTRYCNYGKEKFGGITFIEPYWYKDTYKETRVFFLDSLTNAEESYQALLNSGLKPQDAREVLPLATKTELVMTGTVSQWEAFLKLRLDKAAHPDMRIVAQKISDLLKKYE